ncbi:MAG: FtsX-like permease family protein [Acidobacteriota bacterium]
MFFALASVTWRQWRLHRLRTVLTLVGIALGVAVFFAVRTANLTLLSSLSLTIEKLAGKATLQVVAGETGFPEDVWEVVRSTPGVRIAAPVIEVIAQTAFADGGNLLIVGEDTLGEQGLREFAFDENATEMSDPLIYLAQPNSIIISRTFADQHRLKEGDLLPLFTSEGRREFTVRGIFKPTGIGEVFGGQIAAMDVFSMQHVFNRGRNFDRIDLMNEPGVSVEDLRSRLADLLKSYSAVEVTRPAARGKGIENAVSAMSLGMTIASFIALLVGVFIIFNTFSISVNQRWREIGVLRALGVERKGIQWMYLCEAAVMGLIGSAIGVFVGFYLASGAARLMAEIAASIYSFVSTPESPIFRWDFALLAFALGLGTSLIAAWLPARAASRLNPVLALHNIETRQRESVLGRGRIVAGLLMILIGLAFVRFAPLRVGLKIQFLYLALITLGLILLLPKLSELMARLMRPIMDRVFGTEGVLAVDAMIQSPRRTSATVGALMIGLMFVFSIAAYVQSYERTVTDWMDRMLNADLFITTSEMARTRTYHFSEAFSRKVASVPGVKRIENVRFMFVPYEDDTVALLGFEMDGWFSRVRNVIEGGDEERARVLATSGEGVVVARNFTSRWGLGVGDIVKLKAPTGVFERPIVGVIEDYTSEKGAIFVDRSLLKKYWNDDSVDILDVNLNPGVNRAAFKTELQRAIKGEHRAFVYTNEEYKSWVVNLIDGFFVLNYMQMAIAVLVATLGIVNTLIISVAERSRELGVLRALGGLRSQVRKMILLEAAAIAVTGVVAGAIAGALNTYFLVRTAASMIGGYTIPYRFPFWLILVTLPIVLVIALVAGWWPARRAVRLNVVEAIGYE